VKGARVPQQVSGTHTNKNRLILFLHRNVIYKITQNFLHTGIVNDRQGRQVFYDVLKYTESFLVVIGVSN